jgi:hypothetical protein
MKKCRIAFHMYNSTALSPFSEKVQSTPKADSDKKCYGNTIEYIFSVKYIYASQFNYYSIKHVRCGYDALFILGFGMGLNVNFQLRFLSTLPDSRIYLGLIKQDFVSVAFTRNVIVVIKTIFIGLIGQAILTINYII